MKNLLTFIVFITTSVIFAQNKFQLGYYTDISGQKIEGEISDVEYINTTNKILFRKNKNDIISVKADSLISIKNGDYYFVKKHFQIDPRSNFDIDRMSSDDTFNLENRTSFLQLIVDGDYKLYKYTENGNIYFFYEDTLGKISTLKYKKHIDTRNTISEHKPFIEQLKSLADTTDLDNRSVTELKYNETDLMKYFITLNGESYRYNSKTKVKFNFFVGYSIHSMDIDFVTDLPAEHYSHLIIIPEIEYILNVNNKNQTSFYFNLRLHNFKKDFVEFYERDNWHHKVSYVSLVANLGVKQYFLSSKKFKFYAKGGVGFNNPIKSNVQSPPDTWAVKTIVIESLGSGINTGVGLKVFDKFLVELDYDLMFNMAHINKNTSLNLKVGYSF